MAKIGTSPDGLKIGDRVQLNSGSPDMHIKSFWGSSAVVQYIAGGIKKTDQFPRPCLTRL